MRFQQFRTVASFILMLLGIIMTVRGIQNSLQRGWLLRSPKSFIASRG